MYEKAGNVFAKFKVSFNAYKTSLFEDDKDKKSVRLIKMIKLVANEYKSFIVERKIKLTEFLNKRNHILIQSSFFEKKFNNINKMDVEINKHLVEYSKMKILKSFDILNVEFSLEILSAIYNNISSVMRIQRENCFNLHFIKIKMPPKILSPKEFEQKEAMIIFNRILKVFLIEWSRNKFFNDKMAYKIFKNMNKKKPSFLSQINVLELNFSMEISEIKNVKIVALSPNKVIFEGDYFIKGDVNFSFETSLSPKYKLLYKLSKLLKVDINVTHLMGHLRIVYQPRTFGKSVLSFMETPEVTYKVKAMSKYFGIHPDLDKLNLAKILLDIALKGFVYPEFASIGIPMTKKNRTTAFGTI